MLVLLNFKKEYNRYLRKLKEENNLLGLRQKSITKESKTYYYYYIKERRPMGETHSLVIRKRAGQFKGDVHFKDRFVGKEKPDDFLLDMVKPILEQCWLKENHLVLPEDAYTDLLSCDDEFKKLETIYLSDVLETLELIKN